MVQIAGMTFGEPDRLWLLLLVPAAVWFVVTRERARRSLSNRFVSERLRGDYLSARTGRPVFLATAFLFALLAAAGPRAGWKLEKVAGTDAARIIAIDLSMSMAAEDVGASRLELAKTIGRRLIQSHAGRVGLIAFEGTAEIVSPLTTDGEAVISLLETLQPGELALPGSDLTLAVERSVELAMSGGGAAGKEIIILSDGEDRSRPPDEAAAAARSRGLKVTTVVIGTVNGGKIPLGDGRFLADENSREVVTAANESTMRAIANGTGGRFFVNPFDESSLAQLTSFSGLSQMSSRSSTTRLPIERYQWPLALSCFSFFLASIANRGAE